MINDPVFIPKRPEDSIPWLEFGGREQDYTMWAPHICGVCCLKMIGDTLGVTNSKTLFDLTQNCLSKGAFKIRSDGSIDGIYHYPLIQVAKELGLAGKVEQKMSIDRIKEAIAQGDFVILSIDLAKIKNEFTGSHLVLIYKYCSQENAFLSHDCARVLSNSGIGVELHADYIDKISNHRGMTFSKH